MPYLRLSSLPLDETTKRLLADELTATVLELLPGQKPEWTSVHFTPFEPSEFAIAGRLIADGAVPDTHLELVATGIDERRWLALRNRLTDVIGEALGLAEDARGHVTVKLHAYDPHTFAVGGIASDELETVEEHEQRGRLGWLRSTVLVGFAIGAYFGYRWLSERLGSDATVDAAPPLAGRAPEVVDTAG